MSKRNHILGSEGTQLNDEFVERDYQYPAEEGSQTGDMASAGPALDALERAPAGELPPGYDVRSTYDVRPVNARDFNVTATAEVATTTDITFQVPQGYVAVLRRIRHFLADPVPASDDRNDVLLTVLIDTAAVPYNLDLPVGIEADDIATYFELADENSIITARFTLTAAIVATGADLTATFCGNLLAKSGRPLPFEIANPSSGTSAGQSAPPILLAPPPPAPAPTRSAAPPPPPVPSMAIPPFELIWGYNLDARGPRQYIPMAKVGKSGKRMLTAQESVQYRDFIDASRPRS